MRVITTKYEEVKTIYTKNKPCSKCGNKISRTFSTVRTINPFHSRTRDELWNLNVEELEKTEKAWLEQADICSNCKKEKTPDVNFERLTQAKINLLLTECDAISELEKKINLCRQNIRDIIGSGLEIKNGDEILEEINSRDGFYFNLRKIRKDRKGLTEQKTQESSNYTRNYSDILYSLVYQCKKEVTNETTN